MKKTIPIVPNGQLMLKMVAMPDAINTSGYIFGGWLMSQMDLCGAILAKQIAENRVVTAQANNINFLSAGEIGDLILGYATCIKTKRSSIIIDVEIWAENSYKKSKKCLTQGTFTFVSVDSNGNPSELKPENQNLSFD